MTIHIQQAVLLRDAKGRQLGELVADRIQGDRIGGTFTPGLDYAQVADLFARHHAAVNEQRFTHVEELDQEIEELRLRLVALDDAVVSGICEAQIGNGRITFRIGKAPTTAASVADGVSLRLEERQPESLQ